MQHRDLYPALITLLALLVYVWNFMGAGQARGKIGRASCRERVLNLV